MSGRLRVESIETLADPRVEPYRDLREGRLLDAQGVFVAESRLVVRRLLAGARFPVRSLFLADAAWSELRPEVEALADPPLVLLASHALLCEVAGYPVHQGCLALAERGTPLAVDALAARARAGAGRLVGIERLGDPANVGSVFRNALAFGADGVLLAGGGADPLFRKAVRVSMAATLTVPFAHASAWPAAFGKLRAEGFRIVACVADPGATPLAAFDPAVERLLVLFGNEGGGLDPATIAAADETLTIPMASGADSVNVATASGIVLHHFAPRRAPS